MKHGKRPTTEQKKAIERAELEPGDWLIMKIYPNSIVLRHRRTDEIKVIDK